MPTVAQRSAAFGETIFSEITALAQAHDAVNLGQGFPDFAPPDFVLQAAARAAADGAAQQYARGPGHPELVQALAEQLGPRLGRALDPLAEVTVTVGATEGLFASLLALVDPGDEVVLIEPYYDSYPADVLVAGGRCRYVPLRPGSDGAWTLDRQELERAFSARTKAILLNSPHNPTGKVFSREELGWVAELCQRHDAVAICDEVYDRIVFDGMEAVSLCSLPGMERRSVLVGSAGKTFSVTGWKIGWVVCCPELSQAVRRMHQWIPFCVATPLQRAVAEVLRRAPAEGYYEQLQRMYQHKRDVALQALAGAGLRPLTPQGTYFVMADTAPLGLAGDDRALCQHLIEQVGVASIPPSVFYCTEHQHHGRQLLRFSFCKDEATLQLAGERLARLGG